MRCSRVFLPFLAMLLLIWAAVGVAQPALPPLASVAPPDIRNDASIMYDYPIIYVRSPRWLKSTSPQVRQEPARWAEFGHPQSVNPGSDLILLHPSGAEEVLVAAGVGAVQDPYVSFDGETVFYTLFHLAGLEPNKKGADIYKIHVPTRTITRLTEQVWATNKGQVPTAWGVYNMHPCPLPGGKVAYVSNRHAYLPPPKSYPLFATQLHVMDADGRNVETIGHLNLGGALHPTILTDGRIIFSGLENQGLRNNILWGIWSIQQDGTGWGPVISAFVGPIAPAGWHFCSQLSDGRIVCEIYYNQNQQGFGTFATLPLAPPAGQTAFAPATLTDPRNAGWKMRGGAIKGAAPFTPAGLTPLTLWTQWGDDLPGLFSIPGDRTSPMMGKVTHPSGAPDNHLLLVWTAGPTGGSAGAVTPEMGPSPIDSGIYLLINGEAIDEPGKMRLIKNDPDYNEQWPHALVSYQRMYGIPEPPKLVQTPSTSKYLPEGTPWGLIGTSSLYKRESAPLGVLPAGEVTSVTKVPPGTSPWNQFLGTAWNWIGQGSDAGRYDNSEIHAIRIVAFEPNEWTPGSPSFLDAFNYPAFGNHIFERLRILGEIPVREGKPEGLLDSDGNPDTSFLAKIPADVVFTFQMLDKDGMVLTTAQTWHQLRPGETRHDCGGCHAHSQQPTRFVETFAASPQYEVQTLADARLVEWHQDIAPILAQRCQGCHQQATAKPGALVLDDPGTLSTVPGNYYRLTMDTKARYGPKRLEAAGTKWVIRDIQHAHMGSHWIWKLQSRRSLLMWVLHGERLDGYDNALVPGSVWALDDPRRAALVAEITAWPAKQARRAELLEAIPVWPLYDGDIDYVPPRDAVGKLVDHTVMMPPEEKRLIAAWIDTGATLNRGNLAPKIPDGLADNTPPTLTLALPEAGQNATFTRLLIGVVDYNTGLDLATLEVLLDAPLAGVPAGANLAPQLTALPGDRWEWVFPQPVGPLERATMTVRVKDRAGNRSETQRTFSAMAPPPPPVTHVTWSGLVAPETTAVCQVDGIGAVLGAQKLQCAALP